MMHYSSDSPADSDLLGTRWPVPIIESLIQTWANSQAKSKRIHLMTVTIIGGIP